jgi:hypothetical protein
MLPTSIFGSMAKSSSVEIYREVEDLMILEDDPSVKASRALFG